MTVEIQLKKKCSKCKQLKFKTDFVKNGDRLRSACKECSRRPGVKPRTRAIDGKKICSQCKQNKLLEDYHKREDRKNGIMSHCKECEKNRNAGRKNKLIEYNRKYYLNNKEKVKQRSKIAGDEKMEYITNIKCNTPCTDCGKNFEDNPECLDFDHIDDTTKKFNLSGARWHTWEEIEKELDKVEIVCSNCHRIRTKKSGQYKTNGAKGHKKRAGSHDPRSL